MSCESNAVLTAIVLWWQTVRVEGMMQCLGEVFGMTTSSTRLDALCANPLKRDRLHRDECWLHERVRGVDKPLAPGGLGVITIKADLVMEGGETEGGNT